MNRNNTITQNVCEKLENSVTIKPANNVGLITRRRPFVSAKKPHRCELVMIPAKLMALNTPLS